MHKLSDKIDLSFLSEAQLQMICFAPYSLYLHFTDGIVITIEGLFEHVAASDRKRPKKYSFPIGACELTRLLAQHVQSYSLLADSGLQLDFSNGDALIITGDNGPYESYQIQHAGGQIVV